MKQFRFFEKKIVPQTTYYEPLGNGSISSVWTPTGTISSYTRSATNNPNTFKECFVGNTDFFYFYWRDQFIRNFGTIRGRVLDVEREDTIRIRDFYEIIQRLRDAEIRAQGIVTGWSRPIISEFSYDGCTFRDGVNIQFSDQDMMVNIKWEI